MSRTPTSVSYGSSDFVAAMQGTTVNANPPAPDSGPVSSAPTDEFGRFAELTEKLTKVPKSEVDEKRKTS